ncbi:MAG: hypothetical protein LBM98_11260 [Oscillospiraceae bacterium]|nr:hypothetical protein [Oscillospiraceae bacterium]
MNKLRCTFVGAGFKPALPPSLRSTGKCAIRTQLQVRSNPVPGGQHTDYVS